jgi:CheY-like chemotaxis protein
MVPASKPSSVTLPSLLTVLVVDDEALVRMCAVEILRDAGHMVFEAADAEEALAVLDTSPSISVLFTDINMPGDMDGLSLARRVQQRRPDVRVILTSGRLQLPVGMIPAGGGFLPKPYAGEAVLRLVSQISG